ncbi:MAG: hypothetical protein V1870_05160 [Candidatus Aenigmatarchaeota archaeon]
MELKIAAEQLLRTMQEYGIDIRVPFDRYCHCLDGDREVVGHIFCYREKIPTAEDEPELYNGAKISEEDGAVILRHHGFNEEVWLMTVEADDLYRMEHPEIIAKNEKLRIDTI